MPLVLRKVTFQVHVDQVDDAGHIEAEGVLMGDAGQPVNFVAFAHQVGTISQRVLEAVEGAAAVTAPSAG